MAEITEVAQTDPVVGTTQRTEGEIVADTTLIEPEEVVAEPLESFTVAELREMAEQDQIDLAGATRKAEIIERITLGEKLPVMENEGVLDYRLLYRASVADPRRGLGRVTPGSEGHVRALESMLVDTGHLDQVQRSVRGSFSPQLHAALRAWKVENGFDEFGEVLDAETVRQLAEAAGYEVVNLPEGDEDEDEDEEAEQGGNG